MRKHELWVSCIVAVVGMTGCGKVRGLLEGSTAVNGTLYSQPVTLARAYHTVSNRASGGAPTLYIAFNPTEAACDSQSSVPTAARPVVVASIPVQEAGAVSLQENTYAVTGDKADAKQFNVSVDSCASGADKVDAASGTVQITDVSDSGTVIEGDVSIKLADGGALSGHFVSQACLAMETTLGKAKSDTCQ